MLERALTQCDCIAAEHFVHKYYHALDSSRQTIATFYMPAAAMPDGKPLPAILFNGNIIPDAEAMQAMYQQQMPPTRYEVQSYDCQVLNPNYVSDGSTNGEGASGNNMTFLVVVSGYVKMGEPKEAKMKGFSETFVLVPKLDTHSTRGRGKAAREWLIQSQNFRLVV